MRKALADALRAVEIFADLHPEQIAWLVAHGSEEVHEDGALIFAPGSEADSMTAVLEGAIEVTFAVGGQQIPFLTQRAGSVTGMLPFSRLRTYSGSGHASGQTRLYRLPQSEFNEMLRVAPVLGPKLVALMTDRVRESTRLTQQREKMMALGKLAAGLAHEINNPAAAAGRSAALLQDRLRALPGITEQLLATNADLSGAIALLATLDATTAKGDSADAAHVNGLARAAREDAVTDWLESHGVDESWLLADTFVEAGVDAAALDTLAAGAQTASLGSLVRWLDTVIAAQRLAAEIHASAARVSELVAAVKIYSHMDRPGVREPVDLRQGIDSTLVMLGHKLKRGNIVLERAFAADLPLVEGYPGELNQVWTNLIDNAIDAMSGGGTLRVEGERDGSSAVIRIVDSGTGIPPEMQPRIFEAFFTTKPVGEGTGLGLDIVQRIVVQQHDGRIDLESRPGRTVFTVRLPVSAR